MGPGVLGYDGSTTLAVDQPDRRLVINRSWSRGKLNSTEGGGYCPDNFSNGCT